ncbi:MAG: sensor histidine kinase [Lagierella massiliensis]|nr:sensor histidine kinase [Lagierella massiliensis]
MYYEIFERTKLNLKNKRLYDELQEEILKVNAEYSKNLSDLNSYLTLWAHQVKTPLASILMIADRSGDKSIEIEVQKTEEYISQMINFMKSRENSKDYSFRMISLENIVKKTIRKYRLFFIKNNIKLELDIVEKNIITDPKWFSFVIDQIVFNSLKYTKKGHIRISNRKDKDILEIEDTGIGIPEEDIPMITSFGFTGQNGRNYSNSTGIGLYLVDDILSKFKYNYKIDSKVGVGTKFKINLNRKDIVEE